MAADGPPRRARRYRCRPSGVARRVAGQGRTARPGRSGCGWCARCSSRSATCTFERVQDDDRDHAEWILEADRRRRRRPAPCSTMDLEYTGDLWAESVLRRILDDEVARGRATRCARSSGRRPGAEPAVGPALELQRRGRSSALRSSASRTSSIGPEAQHPSRRAAAATWVMPGGMSSTWWVTSTSGGAVGSAARSAERRDELLSTGEVESGRRLVEQHEGRVVHQRPGQQDPLALARRQRAERSRSAKPPDPHPLEAGQRPLVVGRRVPVPPRLEGGVAGRPHDVERAQRRAQLVGEGGRGVADAPPQTRGRRHARGARRARRRCPTRVVVQRGDAQQRRLAAAVGAEQQPALAGLDAQRDVARSARSPPRRTLTWSISSTWREQPR